jgi:peroxiredoxin
MLQLNDTAKTFTLSSLDGSPYSQGSDAALLIFFETDCPTCQLAFPYLEKLVKHFETFKIIGISQDNETATREFVERNEISFPILLDHDLSVSRAYDPVAVPTLFLLDNTGKIVFTQIAFDKNDLNTIAAKIAEMTSTNSVIIAEKFDGNPDSKPGCTSRHLEGDDAGVSGITVDVYQNRGERASRIELAENIDPFEYCLKFDPLPVIPPTIERVEKMLQATTLAPEEIIGLIAPNYGAATVEKIAANAVMAGCAPEMMRVLIPLIRAACDERFNLHGVQATTHFAAPLIILNGAIRNELGFVSGGNVFSNVARANSTLGRAFQLILKNIGGAKAGEIDMSTLGNPGKFSYCIAENEEENPWEPFHVEAGFSKEQSTLTLFAAEPLRGVSEHFARDGRTILQTISHTLATSWSYRVCSMAEAFVVLCPEHVKTLHRDGFTKESIRVFLYENTGIPVRFYSENDGGEGTHQVAHYTKAMMNGEACYRKFARPEAIKILVAGGTAGKFSAVINSWVTGPRGSQIVTYPI